MIIDDLARLLAPPAQPLESGRGADWGSVTDRIGEPLPVDFMQFIDRYGTGIINDFLTVLNPFSANARLNLLDQMFYHLSALRSLKAQFPGACPYPLFFEPGGLLPWGITIDSDIFCWKTSGVSGQWTQVIFPRHGDAEEHNMTTCALLAAAIGGSITSSALPAPFAGRGGSVEFRSVQSAL